MVLTHCKTRSVLFATWNDNVFLGRVLNYVTHSAEMVCGWWSARGGIHNPWSQHSRVPPEVK